MRQKKNNMKQICSKCNAICPEFSLVCHKCSNTLTSNDKQFWLEMDKDCNDIIWNKPVNEDTIHVIEYIAYENLKIKNKIMKEALEFIFVCHSFEGDKMQLAAANALNKINTQK